MMEQKYSTFSDTLEDIGFVIHQNAVNKGFWDRFEGAEDVNFILKQLAMIHSEVSEVLEAVRKERSHGVIAEEFADILIRLLDLYTGMQQAGYKLPVLGEALMEKVEINESRPRMHGVLA